MKCSPSFPGHMAVEAILASKSETMDGVATSGTSFKIQLLPGTAWPAQKTLHRKFLPTVRLRDTTGWPDETMWQMSISLDEDKITHSSLGSVIASLNSSNFRNRGARSKEIPEFLHFFFLC